MSSARVRARTPDDLDGCVRLAGLVHRHDAYPPYVPTDLRTFLRSPDALAAWVAERDGEIVGHVALHRRTSPAVLALAAEALGRPADRLGVIARLLVAPDSRRGGLGRALLEGATQEARNRDLWPMLDVATRFGAAVKLYEDSGWVKAGQVTFRADIDTAFEEFVYLGPAPPPPEERATTLGGVIATGGAGGRDDDAQPSSKDGALPARSD